MQKIEINISNKIATLKEKFVGVCGNSDYVVVFDFDDEWKSHATKTARFKYNGKYEDVVFTGNECPMPIILDTASVEIGVYAGKLHTTTSACVLMKTCILSGSGVPADPTPDVYNQIIDKIDAGMLKGDKGDKGAPGKDGKDGSDATVTAQNIESALGYAPVKDVQVAGTSVMTDGVANVPIASATTPGVVSILKPGDSGIWNDNGSLKISYATNEEISTRSGYRKAIVCTNLDTAVKAAMCDGKGAAWTSAEQKAARERMGVDKEYELIEEIALTESSTVMRTNEPDGTPYKFDKLKYCVIVPAAAASRGLYVNAVIYSNTGIYAISYSALSSNVDNVVVGEMKKEGATWECRQPASGKIGPQAMYKTGQEFLSIPNAYGEYIAKFSINVALPTDTKIYIYGVRV